MKEDTRIFLCHANEDKEKAYQLYKLLKREGYTPWLDKESLLPGQKWEIEIPKAIRESDFVITLFSKYSVAKKGYIQKEVKLALEVLDEVPDDQIFVIPVRLDECEIPFRLRGIHYCDYSGEDDFKMIHKAIEAGRIRLNNNNNNVDTLIPRETDGLLTLARRASDVYGLPFVEFDRKGLVLEADNYLKAVSEGRLEGDDTDLVVEALSRAVADTQLLNYEPEWVVAYIALGPTDYPEDETNLIGLFRDELGFIEYVGLSTLPPPVESLIREYPKQKEGLSSYIYFYTPLQMLRSRLKKYYVTRLYSTKADGM